jgi:tetratricopeptide (TPR) repeat protein
MQSKVAAGFLALLLSSGLVGCRTSSTSLQPGETQARRGNAEAYSLYLSGRYRDAERVYERSYQLALALGETEEAFLCLNGVGGARFAMFQYREAMQAYLEARRLAQKIGKAEMLAAVQTNLSSLYLQQQEINAGARAADEALQALGGAGPTRFGALLLTQSAILHSRQGNLEAALPLFGEALEEAAARGNPTTLSLIWDQLGYELLTRGRLEDAERALLEGFRIRKLNRLTDLQYSYYTLGMLRLAQGDPATARLLLDESLARLSKAPVTLALWRVYYERGRAESGLGRVEAALSDFRQAVEYARRVRLEVLPSDSVWINTGVDQDRPAMRRMRDSGLKPRRRTGLPVCGR